MVGVDSVWKVQCRPDKTAVLPAACKGLWSIYLSGDEIELLLSLSSYGFLLGFNAKNLISQSASVMTQRLELLVSLTVWQYNLCETNHCILTPQLWSIDVTHSTDIQA